MRYPLVGGTRERHFDGTRLEPRKLLENAQTPASRVHAVLASGWNRMLISRCGLEQSPDQDGQAGQSEQQQARSPQEGQEVIAM